MKYHIVTLFPQAFDSYFGESILKRALEDGKISIKFYNPRDFTADRHKRIDRQPYGGGPGMVIQAEPVLKAIQCALKSKSAKEALKNKKLTVVWLSPSAKQFTTAEAKKSAKKYTEIVFICGRYEGIDSRVKKGCKNLGCKIEEISVGPYVTTGGELPAMTLIDSISRQIPGVLGDIMSLEENRISSPDVYTRPEIFKWRGKSYRVPSVLLSGNHKKIDEWKKRKR